MAANEQMTNPFEEAWVQHALAASLGNAPSQDADLQRAIAESAANGISEDDALQRALRESCNVAGESFSVRRLMGSEGPFFPAGLANSGNSCFWNALLQALFAATPIFRGALFQTGLAAGGPGVTQELAAILGLLRDLFAEMDMGLANAIDAGDLYRSLFHRAEEADVSEQMQRLFESMANSPGPLKAVCGELFSGDLYEHLQGGGLRRVPLDLCQLDLCITVPAPLEQVLEEHTLDPQGHARRRSYRLPPVLWLNLDRFAYDREAQRGRKQQVRMAFPEMLNAWMLVPPDAKWNEKLQRCARRRKELLLAIQANRSDVERQAVPNGLSEVAEEGLVRLVEQQEELGRELQGIEEAMAQHGAEQELLYQLQAVIVHRGRVDSGHYLTYARSPAVGSRDWCCLNDSKVTVCSAAEMRRVCEGSDAAATPGAPSTAADADAREEASTAARCLIYVRSNPSSHGLVGEVKQRVPTDLQEHINTRNIEFLRQSVERVSEDFVRCVRRLTAHAVEEKEDDEHEYLQEALRVAATIRTEGGMPHARIYLLKSCWLAHIPWLPEELCATAIPPDFRMHYGSDAKRMLLDALIQRGQHDVATLIVSKAQSPDAFIPQDMKDWLAKHKL